MEEVANLGGYRLTEADHIFFAVYGDHLHHNTRTQLERGVSKDDVCQCLSRRIRKTPKEVVQWSLVQARC